MLDTGLLLDKVCQHAREIALLESTNALLGWDERTLLPVRAGAYRAEQMTCLSGLIHQRSTDPQVGEWLDQLADSPAAADPHSDVGATIRQLRREYKKKIKLPQSLVEELTRTAVLGQQAWVEAREQDNFAGFQPLLVRIVDLKRQQAAAIGYSDCPYDALLDDYEPDAQTSNVRDVLDGLRRELVPLVAAIQDSGREPDRSILTRNYSVDRQRSFGTQAASAIGFDFERGRLDVTHHPFCSSMGPHDCRITTRYDERFFPGAFFGTLHEAGHGMYDQGLRTEQYGLPPGTYLSLGIHESQSRMWENLVGRSLPFWQYLFGAAVSSFPEALQDVQLDDFYFAINDVRPSLIRVEADEATYNLHIIIRFELEQALLDDQLQVGDLPGAWNEKYEQYLGIRPPTDADGVLQDIHWSAGLIGYFPTYSLGNLYAAQLFAAADAELGGLHDQFARGEFAPLLEWLRTNIHQAGQCYPAAELVQCVTGKSLSHEALIAQLNSKLAPLYGI
jgi:carboxypeptidase Taq